ncbi:MAG: FixH family protein [Phycisphaerales bacterium]
MNAKKRQGAFWIGLVLALFGAHMFVAAALMYFAHSDPAFAVVPDYYDKALAWDETKRQEAASDALGWRILLVAGPDSGPVQERDLTLTLVDEAGETIDDASVTVEAFHVARSRDVASLEFARTGPGLYTTRARLPKYGIWEFRIDALRGDSRFVRAVRVELRPGRSASS